MSDNKSNKNVLSESCGISIIHEEVIKNAKNEMVKEETLYDLAEFFKIFGDSTRIKILNALFLSEMCVCDLASLLGMTQSAISHQLKILKQSRLVKFRRCGKIVYYSLDDQHIKQIFDIGLTHVTEK